MTDRVAKIGEEGSRHKEPAVKLDVKPNGSLIVSLGSFTRPGLYSSLEIKEAHRMTYREMLKATGIVVASLAEHQGRNFLDNHDVGKTMEAVIEATAKILKDGTPRVWVNKRHYEPFAIGTVKTMDIPNPTRPNWT